MTDPKNTTPANTVTIFLVDRALGGHLALLREYYLFGTVYRYLGLIQYLDLLLIWLCTYSTQRIYLL